MKKFALIAIGVAVIVIDFATYGYKYTMPTTLGWIGYLAGVAIITWGLTQKK